jgi:hypothetical protein
MLCRSSQLDVDVLENLRELVVLTNAHSSDAVA